MLEGNSAALQARPSPEVALLMDNPEVFYSLMHSFLHSTFFFLIDYQCWNQNNQTQVCPYSVVEGTDSEAKMTGGWDRSNVVASQHHREGHAHTVSVQKGTEEEELKDRAVQVEGIERTETERRDGAAVFTEIKHYDRHRLCVCRNGKNLTRSPTTISAPTQGE